MPNVVGVQVVQMSHHIERVSSTVFPGGPAPATGTTVLSDTLSYMFVDLGPGSEELGWLRLIEQSLAGDWERPEDAICDDL